MNNKKKKPDKTAGMEAARTQRSIEKRRAVENAIEELKNRNEAITFKAIALIASVSRQYLYNNFKDEISSYRSEGRSTQTKIDGISVPTRTPDEHRHIEALLRNKLERQKEELKKIRVENGRLKLELEKERGRSEHFRRNWLSKTGDI